MQPSIKTPKTKPATTPTAAPRVVQASLLILLAGTWSLYLHISRQMHDDFVRQLGEQQYSTVSTLAGQVNQQLEIRLRALEQTAAQAGSAFAAGTAALQAFIEEQDALGSLFNDALFVTDGRGIRIAYTPHHSARVGIDLFDRDYVTGPLLQGKATVGKPIIGRTVRSPVFVIGAPISNPHGQFIGVLAGSTMLSIPNFLDKISANRPEASGDFLLVAPKERLIVAATDKSRILKALPAAGINPLIDRLLLDHDGYSIAIGPNGSEMIASAQIIPAAGWYAIAMRSTDEAFAPLQQRLQGLLAATILFSLLVGFLAWRVLRVLKHRAATAHRTGKPVR